MNIVKATTIFLLLVAHLGHHVQAASRISNKQHRQPRIESLERIDCSVVGCTGSGYIDPDQSPKHVLESLIDFDSFDLLPGWTFNGQDGVGFMDPRTKSSNFKGIGLAHLDPAKHRYASEAAQGAVILTTGDASYAAYTLNSNNYTSFTNGGVQNALLSSYCSADGTGDVTADCAVFEFRVRAKTSDDLFFKLGFASDEYREYGVFPLYNDVCSFSVDGMEQALVPGTDLRISIANVNPITNHQYYEEAGGGIEYWGYTKTFLTSPAAFRFIQGREYDMFLGVCDCFDSSVDSAVYLPYKTLRLCTRAPNIQCPADETFVCAASPSLAVARTCNSASQVMRDDEYGAVLFPSASPYIVKYKAVDSAFGSVSCSFQVQVTASAPTVDIQLVDFGFVTVASGITASFVVSASDECGLVQIIVDFGDGVVEQNTITENVNEMDMRHVYGRAGTYLVTLKAMNVYGMESTDTVLVGVEWATAIPIPTSSPGLMASASATPCRTRSPIPTPKDEFRDGRHGFELDSDSD